MKFEQIKQIIASGGKRLLDIIAFVSLIFIGLAIGGYVLGFTCNWVIIAFMALGIWSLVRIGPKLRPIENIFSSIAWYICTFLVVWGTLYILGANSLLGMYTDWSGSHGRTIWGFFRIFAPLFVLMIGSTMIAAVSSKPRSFSKKVVIFCMCISVFGLFLYGLASAFDKWFAVYKDELAQNLDADRLSRTKYLGVFATTEKEDVFVYRVNSKKKAKGEIRYDRVTMVNGEKFPDGYTLTPKVKYPLVNDIEVSTKKDGPNRIVEIYLEDENDDFNGQSETAWIRLGDVDIVHNTKPFPEAGPSAKGSDGVIITVDLAPDEVKKVIPVKSGQKWRYLTDIGGFANRVNKGKDKECWTIPARKEPISAEHDGTLELKGGKIAVTVKLQPIIK